MAEEFALFDTAIGSCGIAWGDRGIVRVQLPERSSHGTRARLVRGMPTARETQPTPDVERAIQRIAALVGGARVDLSDVVVDLSGVPDFHRRVYDIARSVPAGKTTTYGEVATRLGDPGSARAVGQALGSNPVPIIVPCHRVLAANGKLGGFSATGGAATKRRLLIIEGVLLQLAL